MTVIARQRLLVGILPAVAALAGLYLLAWSVAWPHPDMRNAWAIVGGVLLVVAGILAGVIVWRARSRAALTGAVLASIAAVAIGAFVLSTISDDQAAACGTELAACRSLLPGF